MSDWAAAWAVDLFGWASGFWRPWGHGAEDPWGWVAEDSAGGGFVGGGGKWIPTGDPPNGFWAGITPPSPVLATDAAGLGSKAETAAGAAFPDATPSIGSTDGLRPRPAANLPCAHPTLGVGTGCRSGRWQVHEACPSCPHRQQMTLRLDCPSPLPPV